MNGEVPFFLGEPFLVIEINSKYLEPCYAHPYVMTNGELGKTKAAKRTSAFSIQYQYRYQRISFTPQILRLLH